MKIEKYKPASMSFNQSIQLNQDQCSTTSKKTTEMKKFPY